MIDLDTPFHKRVTKLKSPTSASFDAKAWAALLDDESGATEVDSFLVAGAMLIAAESAKLRSFPADPELAALDAATETALCVAALNAEFLTVQDLSGNAVRRAIEDVFRCILCSF
jgi:hypothetical protein